MFHESSVPSPRDSPRLLPRAWRRCMSRSACCTKHPRQFGAAGRRGDAPTRLEESGTSSPRRRNAARSRPSSIAEHQRSSSSPPNVRSWRSSDSWRLANWRARPLNSVGSNERAACQSSDDRRHVRGTSRWRFASTTRRCARRIVVRQQAQPAVEIPKAERPRIDAAHAEMLRWVSRAPIGSPLEPEV